MGFELSEDEDEQPSPKEKEQSKYHSAEQQPETLHNFNILQGAEWECKEEMQELWGSSLLYRRYNHQKPPGGPKGQRSYVELEWGHL